MTVAVTAFIAFVTAVTGVVAAISQLDTGVVTEAAPAAPSALTWFAGVWIVGAVAGAVARVLAIQRLTLVVAAALAAVSSA